jgi:dUTP pyrophosphatase
MIENNVLYFAKTSPYGVIPTKREEDGCYDLYACFEPEVEEIVIMPSAIKLVGTGVASAFSSDYRFSVRERGSNTKSGLSVRAGQVDSGFRGQIFVALRNENDVPVVITRNPKKKYEFECIIHDYKKAIAQGALEVVPVVTVAEIPMSELLCFSSDRGAGMLGSSGK